MFLTCTELQLSAWCQLLTSHTRTQDYINERTQYQVFNYLTKLMLVTSMAHTYKSTQQRLT